MNTTAIKICGNCNQSFEITDADDFMLEKIGQASLAKEALPHPKLCPDCRQQRRLAWRNERQMYKRKCDFSGKDIISMYPPDSPFKVYEQDIWWSDAWDATDFGRDFDFTRSFFEQFRELQFEVPRLALVNKQSENSQFTNHAGKNKNCFMSGCIFNSEDVHYSDWIMDCKDCVDCSYLPHGNELCYETYYAWDSYGAFFCDFIKRCANIWFCYDCINCRDCFMCWNLRNKQYCMHNKQYTKEEYQTRMAKILPMSATKMQEFRKEYILTKQKIAIHPAIYQLQSVYSSGDLLFHSKNCFHCFDSIRMEDCRYCYDGIDVKDTMDIYHVGWAELMYECHAISNGYNCLFCHFTYDNRNAMYCDCTQNCQNVFGCAGLNHKQYCILNKQYSKEEYENLVPKIIQHMGGEWGEFFPIQFSPFAYNQGRAIEYYPLSKKQCEEKRIRWSDYEAPNPQVEKTLEGSKTPEYIKDVTDDILKTAIVCEKSKRLFKISKPELEFYRKTGIPIPRRHPDQRYLERMKQRVARNLWQRNCQKCHKAIETSYSPESPEIIYCEECYLQTVY